MLSDSIRVPLTTPPCLGAPAWDALERRCKTPANLRLRASAGVIVGARARGGVVAGVVDPRAVLPAAAGRREPVEGLEVGQEGVGVAGGARGAQVHVVHHADA